jgi:hypothetical protein
MLAHMYITFIFQYTLVHIYYWENNNVHHVGNLDLHLYFFSKIAYVTGQREGGE